MRAQSQLFRTVQAAGKLWWNRGMKSFPLPSCWAEIGSFDLNRLRMVAYTQDGYNSALQAVQEVHAHVRYKCFGGDKYHARLIQDTHIPHAASL
jgi:hypothetical protein